MKKIIFSWILLFILSTTAAHSTIEYAYKQHVKQNVYKALTLIGTGKKAKRIRRQWNANNINTLTNTLLIAEHYTDIPHKNLLSTILTESDMDIYCIPKHKNLNGTIDIGLTQQNSPYIKTRYRVARKILNKAGIDYSNNVFDISTNVMAGAIVLKEFKKELKDRGIQTKYAHYIAYNVGTGGFFKKKLAAKRAAYLRRYKRFFKKL
jgi:hypothetical protein